MPPALLGFAAREVAASRPAADSTPASSAAPLAGIIVSMNVDHILRTLNEHRVEYILIGGMNFLLRHAPVLTFDVDVWIEDTAKNRQRCEKALGAIQAAWGASDAEWGPVADRKPGWLSHQPVFCLTSPYGSIDVFRAVTGLDSWMDCRRRAYAGQTATGTIFLGLSDEDMLACQMALADNEQKPDRIRFLRRVTGKKEKEKAG